MNTFWATVAGGLIGLLGAFFAPVFAEKRKQNAEMESLTIALKAEIAGLIAIAKHRRFLEDLKALLQHSLSTPGTVSSFYFSARRNSMRVYEANLSRIGILDHTMAKQIVEFYSAVSSILEDIDDMRKGKFTREANAQNRRLAELIQLMEGTLALGEKIIH